MNFRPLLFSALVTTLGMVTAAPYISKINGYSITPPKGWTQRPVSGVGVAYAAAPKNKFATNFNVVVNPAKGMQKITNNATLKAIGDEVQSHLSTTLTDFKLISRKNVTLSGQPAVNLVYYGPNKLQVSQYFTVFSEKAYVLTFITQSSEYAGQLPTFNGVKNSFKLN